MSSSRKPHRIKDGSLVAGVCTGLSSYFSVDVFLIRAAFIIFVFFGGAGIVTYVILILLMPEDPNPTVYASEYSHHESSSRVGTGSEKVFHATSRIVSLNSLNFRNLLGLVLLTIGALSLFRAITGFALIKWEILWPIIIISLGVVILAKSKKS